MIQLIPTDTCYGLSGGFHEADYRRIYELKGRDFAKPLAFLVRDFDDLDRYIIISSEQKEYLKNYPHPWSILGSRREDCMLPVFLDATQYSKISLRVAERCISSEIRDQIDYPIFLTSANLSGQRESTTLEMAQDAFPGVSGYDGGSCDNPPSDIFSFGVDDELIFLRKNWQ